MQTTHRWHRFSAVGFFALVPHVAQAQTQNTSIALNPFDPAPAGDRFFSVSSPHAEGHLVPRASATFDYAHQPLVLSDGLNSYPVVAAQGILHTQASLSISNMMLLYAHLPIALVQQGQTARFADVTLQPPHGVQVGDLRVGARIRILGENDEPFQLATGVSMYFPTAPASSYMGDGGFRVSPEIIAGGVIDRYFWSASFRPVFRTSDHPATLNHAAGVGLLFGKNRFQVSLEYTASTPLQNGSIPLANGKTIHRGLRSNAEVHAGIRGQIVPGLWAGVAAGPGLTEAIGTPQFRVMGMVGWLGAPKK